MNSPQVFMPDSPPPGTASNIPSPQPPAPPATAKPLKSWKHGFWYVLYALPLAGTLGATYALSVWTYDVDQQGQAGVGYIWLVFGPIFVVLFYLSLLFLLVGIVLFSRFVAQRKGWRWGAFVLIAFSLMAASLAI